LITNVSLEVAASPFRVVIHMGCVNRPDICPPLKFWVKNKTLREMEIEANIR
jgi:hypothetical protein